MLDLEKLDEAAAMLAFSTASGILQKSHVFYQQVHSFCSNAMGLVKENQLPQLYPALTRFQHAIQFNCKPVASYLLSGRGKHGCGRNYCQTPQEYVDSHNFSFLQPRSIVRNSPPGHVTNGVIREDVKFCIRMCFEKECLAIANEKSCGYICCIATDEMALKPALEYAPSLQAVLGLVDPDRLTLRHIQEELNTESNDAAVEFLKTRQFVTQAREVRVASLDGKIDFPIGVFYCGNKGGAGYIENMYRDIVNVAERCLSCLENYGACKFYCVECFLKKSVCEDCSLLGYSDWHPLLRPCTSCLRENKLCQRLLTLAWCTDCDPKQKCFMSLM